MLFSYFTCNFTVLLMTHHIVLASVPRKQNSHSHFDSRDLNDTRSRQVGQRSTWDTSVTFKVLTRLNTWDSQPVCTEEDLCMRGETSSRPLSKSGCHRVSPLGHSPALFRSPRTPEGKILIFGSSVFHYIHKLFANLSCCFLLGR